MNWLQGLWIYFYPWSKYFITYKN